MIIVLACSCYSNEDMPELLAQYSYISIILKKKILMMELFCCSGISTLNTKFNISLLLALLAYSTQNQKTQMCDYITGAARPSAVGITPSYVMTKIIDKINDSYTITS